MTVKNITISDLTREVRELLARIEDFAHRSRALVEQVHPAHRDDAKNLLHYLAMRRADLRDLQWQLGRVGLSSLGRSEGSVVSNLRQVLSWLDGRSALDTGEPSGIDLAEESLHRNTRALMGNRPKHRHVYIMVTASVNPLPTEDQLCRFLEAGMNCLRINGAHGSEEDWRQILDRIRSAEARTGTRCRILIDLPGPKIRTHVVGTKAGKMVVKVTRSAADNIIEPARLLLVPAGSSTQGLWIEADFLKRLDPGTTITLVDSRGKRRKWTVESSDVSGVTVSISKTTHLDETTCLLLANGKAKSAILGGWPSVEASLEINEGTQIILRRDSGPNDSSAAADGGFFCTSPEALVHLREKQRVLIDDGKVEAVVTEEGREGFQLTITRVPKPDFKIRSEKGINLPDTLIDMPALTNRDRQILEFALQNADIVALSFVRTPEDLREIIERLKNSNGGCGLVLKIETQAGFMNLPAILLNLMRHDPIGIMIARGDLAVECGFERMAEIQEEILWFCEAARLPCIWATQVLESLAKNRLPSRAEITDAAMGVRAEVVMLNKGPYIEDAVRTLSDVLTRMERHQYKKKNLFRPLTVADFDVKN